MKAKYFILPAAALIAAAVFLGMDGKRVPEPQEQIAAASYEPSEPELVYRLFAADPAKAEARLAELPLEMRVEILAQVDAFLTMRQSDEIAYAEIVRRQIDEKGRVAAISERARKTLEHGGDFMAVDDYLNSVYAAPDERERAAEIVARQYFQNSALKAAEIGEMRAWLGRDAPEWVPRLTGEALGLAVNRGGSMNFGEASALVLRYRESDGNDDLIDAFLSELDPKTNGAVARELAKIISDPAKREKLLRKFE
jgi:hypothetical protein